jgi:hypothetical protein
LSELPTGTVTFLFTDLEGSTRLWEQHPAAMRDALARHDEILREAVGNRDGYVVKTTGDGLHAAFGTAPDAVAAALDAQQALVSEGWALPEPLKVRMGLHTGVADVRDGDYYGPAVNRAARVSAAAHGGQIVASAATADLVRDDLSPEVAFTEWEGLDRLRKELDQDWETLIVDEAHYIKNPKAKRTKAVQQLSQNVDRLYLATGTPIPNWPHEIFTSLQLIHPDKGRPGGEFGSYWRWVDYWFKTMPSKYSDFGFDVLGLRECTPGCIKRNNDPLHPCEHYHKFARENFHGKFLQRLRDDVRRELATAARPHDACEARASASGPPQVHLDPISRKGDIPHGTRL